MREKAVKIIILVIVAIIIVAGIIYITTANNSNNNAINQVNLQNNNKDIQNNNDNSIQNNNNVTNIESVTFYSDGNPNTGEEATIKLGSENAGKSVTLSLEYSRDGTQQNNPEFLTVKADDSGTIQYADTTPMQKYPDQCIITIKDNSGYTKTAYTLETKKGYQTITPESINN
jgi:type II secretory pathway pseudopilin PulG